MKTDDLIKIYHFEDIDGYFYTVSHENTLCKGCWFNVPSSNCPEEGKGSSWLLCLSLQHKLKIANLVFKKIKKHIILNEEKSLW